jgi:hypothetical protein
MIFEDVLRAMLVQLNLVDKRVWLMQAPQKPTVVPMVPYMVFLPVGPSPLHSITAPLDVLRREYQITIFDTSQSRALAIADSLRKRFDGLHDFNYLDIHFGAILYRLQTVFYENDVELHSVVTTFDIFFQYLVNPVINPLRQDLRQDLRK